MKYIKDEMVKPVMTGGVIIGVLVFILPWIGGNRCCCVLYILSGVITAHLLTQKYLPSDRDYLISGALSGGVAGFVSWLLKAVGYILDALVHGRMSIYPSSLMDFILLTIFLLIDSLTSLLLGVTFGTIGAILYRIVVEEMMKR